MYKPINRTTVQVEENKFRMYSKIAPLFYKNSNGELNEIDLTFNDANSSIGEISLMEKGISSVGKRKGNNPYKVVGIRPDNNQNEGTQQLEFTLVNVELDDVKQEFNVETDLDIILRPSRIYQLVKLNKEFSKCKIEFDIHLTNLHLNNEKYESSTKLSEYGFNLTDIGNNNGSDTLGMYNSYSNEKEIPYLDCYVGKIVDEYITTGEYSIEEEFGDSDLSNYTLEPMYKGGSSVYFKDCIVFAVKHYNIDNVENILTNQICNIYEMEIFDDGGSGKYFTKDNKKVGGYYSNDKTFFAFFNTCDIPDKIKTLFQRKSFKDTSFLDITIDSFSKEIKDRLNKDLDIEVNENFYKPINDNFFIKIHKENYCIGSPIAFDENKEPLPYKTTHTLTDNEDGTLRYTKYILPETALNINNAQYLDATISVGTPDEGTVYYTFPLSPGLKKNSGNLNTIRNATTGTGALTSGSTSTDTADILCGDSLTKSTTQGQDGTINNFSWGTRQTHIFFDCSGVSSTVTDLSLKILGGYKISGSVYSPYAGNISIILLKSTATVTVSNAWHNDIQGHTSGWTSSDVTEYSGEHEVNTYSASALFEAIPGSYNLESITMNSDAKSDLQSLSTLSVCFMDYDTIYNNLVTGYGTGTYTVPAERRFVGAQQDHSVVANRPYLEYTTGTVSTPTENSTFFGTNF
jgi:hypothetical protein|tara:strand:- start:990 stop:3053 length:2064 start_codon:yes stop_codon:yes gene_type:complete